MCLQDKILTRESTLGLGETEIKAFFCLVRVICANDMSAMGVSRDSVRRSAGYVRYTFEFPGSFFSLSICKLSAIRTFLLLYWYVVLPGN